MVAHHGSSEMLVPIHMEIKVIVEVTGTKETIDHLKFEVETVSSVTMPEAAGGIIGHPSFTLTLTREAPLDLLFQLLIMDLHLALQLNRTFQDPLCRHLLDAEEGAVGGEGIGEAVSSGMRGAVVVVDHCHLCCTSNKTPMAQ
jgi:hypothetical protein